VDVGLVPKLQHFVQKMAVIKAEARIGGHSKSDILVKSVFSSISLSRRATTLGHTPFVTSAKIAWQFRFEMLPIEKYEARRSDRDSMIE
jgi:hypothetical protein